MDEDKREKYNEIQEKLQQAIGNIIADITKSDERLKRLQIMPDKINQDKIE